MEGRREHVCYRTYYKSFTFNRYERYYPRGNPTLRAVAEEVTFPLSDQDIILGEKMMQFLKHSQDPVMAEKLGLRGGVGLAAPQLDISKRIIAVLVPNITEDGETPQEAYDLQAVMYNPKNCLTLSPRRCSRRGRRLPISRSYCPRLCYPPCSSNCRLL